MLLLPPHHRLDPMVPEHRSTCVNERVKFLDQFINYRKTASETHRSSSSGSGTGLSRRNKCFCRIFLSVYNGVYLYSPLGSLASRNIPLMFRLHQDAPASKPAAIPGGVGVVPIKAKSMTSLSTKPISHISDTW